MIKKKKSEYYKNLSKKKLLSHKKLYEEEIKIVKQGRILYKFEKYLFKKGYYFTEQPLLLISSFFTLVVTTHLFIIVWNIIFLFYITLILLLFLLPLQMFLIFLLWTNKIPELQGEIKKINFELEEMKIKNKKIKNFNNNNNNNPRYSLALSIFREKNENLSYKKYNKADFKRKLEKKIRKDLNSSQVSFYLKALEKESIIVKEEMEFYISHYNKKQYKNSVVFYLKE